MEKAQYLTLSACAQKPRWALTALALGACSLNVQSSGDVPVPVEGSRANTPGAPVEQNGDFQTGSSTALVPDADDASAPMVDAAAVLRDDAAITSPNMRPDAGRGDAGSPTTKPDAQISDAAVDAMQTDAEVEACSLEGTFAVEFLFNAQWEGRTVSGVLPVLAAGTGPIRIVTRLQMREMKGELRATLSACAGEPPDFSAGWLIGELYSAYISDAAWDRPSMPSWDLGLDLLCRQPGCALRSEVLVATLGARSNPSDVWPGRNGPLEQIVGVDHDSDGLAGITFFARDKEMRDPKGKPYDLPPVSWALSPRATQLGLAFQIQAGMNAALTSCDSFSGSVTTGRVEARALACKVRGDSNPMETLCTKAQAEFVDENLPNWVVTGGTVRARRMASDATCGTIRAAFK